MSLSFKFKILIGGLISAAFLIFLANSFNAFTPIQLPIICSFVGPENSPDLLRLSDFLVTGPSNPKVGDTIYFSFKIQNYGQYDLNLGSKGVFVATRDPQNSDVSFGFTRANTTFEVGETITVSASKILDKAGTWKFWPSYHLTFAGAPEKFGPNEWHACTIQVTQPVSDSDQDGVPDNEDNCPQNYNPQQEDIDGDNIGDVCDSCDDRDTDKDKIKNCLDKCPNEPENYNQYQDEDGCPDEAPKPKDTTPPTVSITHSPAEVDFRTNVTFTAIGRDDNSVIRILIYVNGNVVKECAPPDYFERDEFWQCIFTGGPYPVGTLTYRAEAFDGENNKGTSLEKTINVKGLELTPPSAGQEARERPEVPCYISGKLLDFKYYSKTVQVKFCEAEKIDGGCMPTPPYTCFPSTASCKEGGQVWYVDVNRIWAGEERYGNPGPLSYQTQVSCQGTYLIQPVYKAFDEECEWQGSWVPTKSNFVTLAGMSVSDYDFRFNPLDSTSPGVNVAVSEFQSPAIFSGQGNFKISVRASDPNGIQKIKIDGNYTVSLFVSDEKGPLPPPPNNTWAREITIPILIECDSSPCEIPIPYYDRGKAININLKITACDKAGNRVITHYDRKFPTGTGDLTIIFAEPVQVVFYDVPLVMNKNTAFRVRINSSFPYPIETKFKLILPDNKWFKTPPEGIRFDHPPEVWGPIKIPPYPYARDYFIMLPIVPDWQKDESVSESNPAGLISRYEWSGGTEKVPDRRSVPRPVADKVNFSVEIDPENENQETNETNNRFDSPEYEVVKTKPLKFLFFPATGNEFGNCQSCVDFINQGAKKQLEYLLANFPIADPKVSYEIMPLISVSNLPNECQKGYSIIYEEDEDRSEFLKRISRIAKSEGYDFAVAIGCGCGGGCCGGDAVFIGDCNGQYSHVLSHEFNHLVTGMDDVYSYRAGKWEVAYCEFGDHYENCPEEYREKTACQVWCADTSTPAVRNCDPTRTYQGKTSCQLWHMFTGKPENECPDRVRGLNNCQVACEFSLCPIGRAKDDCTGATREKTMCEYWCEEEGGQASYVAPDGRNILPAGDGFWVNRWIPVNSATAAYFMDSCIDRCNCTFPWMRRESLKWCVDHLQCGHRLSDGTIAWGDIGDARKAKNINKDGYLNLLNNRRFKSDVDPEGLLVSGTINKNGAVKLDSFIYLPETFLDIEPGVEGDYYFVLLDKDNKVLSKSGFDVSFYQTDPHGGPIDEVGFVYRIEWKAGTKKIELQDKEGKVLASREVSENKPEVKVISPNGGETFIQGKIIKIKWQANDKDGDSLVYSLSVSKDGGKTWLPIDIDIKSNEYELATFSLEPGDYLVKIRATDGVNTGEDVSDKTFKIIVKSPLSFYFKIIAVVIFIFLLAGGLIFYKKKRKTHK